MTRPTNPELCTAFRALLTHGAREAFAKHDGLNDTMTKTHTWRNDLWKAFAELEERLDPLGVETRRREKSQADG